MARINEILPKLTHLIFRIKLSVLGAENSYIWPLHKSEEYTTMSCYFSMARSMFKVPPSLASFAFFIGESCYGIHAFLLNLNFFMLKILPEALPTGENLQRIGY